MTNYYTIYETQYRLLKSPDEKIIFGFVKKFLDGNEILESTFQERLRTLEKVNRMSVLTLVIYPTIKTLAAPLHALKIQGILSIISEEIEAPDEIIN